MSLILAKILLFSACTLLGKNVSLHQIGGKLGKILYYAIQDDCMRLDAWADITVPLLGQTYTKTLRAYIELDPCSFVFHVAFEGYSYTKVLLSYEWGMFDLNVELTFFYDHYVSDLKKEA